MSFPLLISGVLFALDLVFIQNLVQESSLAGWRIAALMLFAIALPCLAANALIMHRMRSMKTALSGKAQFFWIFQVVGYITSIAGVGASIAAASWWIGVIFVVVTLAAAIVCASALKTLEKQKQKNDTAVQNELMLDK